jgi:N-acyl-L-homoserine lactone synthetase
MDAPNHDVVPIEDVAMIHVITTANRSLYAPQLDEMHRLRWLYYIEERGWSGLAAKQARPGFECDEYDDERAVYLLSLSQAGAVQGAMRLRPMDDKSLLLDHFPWLVSEESGFKPAPDIWEITRLMRSPSYRGSDGALRLMINCAACEFAMTRGIRHYVAVADTFLLAAARALNRHKHRVLGLPADYDEGEAIALMLDPDAEWLAMVRKLAGFNHAMMLELPPPAAEAELPVNLQEGLQLCIRTLEAPRAESALNTFRVGAQAEAVLN